MKARIKSSGELIEVTETPYQDLGGRYFDCPEHKCYYREDKLDFLPEKETAVLEGWIVRDGNGSLNLFDEEPTREEWCEMWSDGLDHFGLPYNSFPSVTWQSEPKRVSIELTLIDE